MTFIVLSVIIIAILVAIGIKGILLLLFLVFANSVFEDKSEKELEEEARQKALPWKDRDSTHHWVFFIFVFAVVINKYFF